MFDASVKSVMSYAAEVWGWKERKELEKIQEKYLRLCLKVDRTTTEHLVRKETGVEKLAMKMAPRAVKFEEKLRRLELGVRRECVRVIDLKRRGTKAERERLEFLESRGWSKLKWERSRE